MEPRPPPQASPSSAVRVLSRAPPPAPASPPHDGGVVVVGFVGGAGGAAARLADRILDAPVFSPGGSARTLAGGVRYHRDGDKRMVFLHLASPPPTPPREAGGGSSGDLPEMLFMFSVCHVIIFLQEGFRFDTQILKNFRLLQSSKHAFAPFVRSLVAPGAPSKAAPSGTPGTPSKATPSGTPTRPTRRASSISPPSRRGGHSGRQPSAISLMSGTGSHASVLPGQCIPVVLFVFEDDIIDGPSAATSLDDMGETSSSNQASGTSKGSGSVVMLARPANKSVWIQGIMVQGVLLT